MMLIQWITLKNFFGFKCQQTSVHKNLNEYNSPNMNIDSTYSAELKDLKNEASWNLYWNIKTSELPFRNHNKFMIRIDREITNSKILLNNIVDFSFLGSWHYHTHEKKHQSIWFMRVIEMRKSQSILIIKYEWY